jgi:hypothetical protein
LASRRQDTQKLIIESVSGGKLKYEYTKHGLAKYAPRDAKGNVCRMRRAGCTLNRSLLRVRWQNHRERIGYNIDGFIFCIRSRFLIQLLDARVRNICRGKNLLKLDTKDIRKGHRAIARAYRRLLPFCAYDESTGSNHLDYPRLLFRRLGVFGQRKGISDTIRVKVARDNGSMTPGPRIYSTAAESEGNIQALLRLLPDGILDKSADRRTCWHCNRQDIPTRLCGLCNFARFCSHECFANAWRSHKNICDETTRRITPDTRRLFEGASSEGANTYREVLGRLAHHADTYRAPGSVHSP